MKTKRKLLPLPVILLSVCALLVAGIYVYLLICDWGFARSLPLAEQLQRMEMVRTAEVWLGTQEGSDRHGQIIDIYNSHKPLAQGYAVTTEDNWCAAFASSVAIQEGHTDIIPTECGCERHIECFMEIDAWEEDDDYIPLPGDYIFYSKETGTDGDNTGWAEHVGIVVGTWNNWIKVIEGNKEDAVTYRYIPIGDWIIRGYGVPDYGSVN